MSGETSPFHQNATAQRLGEEFEKLSLDSKMLSSQLPMNGLNHCQPTTVPIYNTTVYNYKSVDDYASGKGWTYQRIGNPTVQAAEMAINQLEGGCGTFLYGSGSAACYTILTTFLSQGDHVVVQSPIYDGCLFMIKDIMKKFGLESTIVKAGSPIEDFEKEIKPNTKLIWGETPCNPLLAILDMEGFGKLGPKHNVITVVDATFATPYIVQPLKFGVDLVMHSVSKFIGGHHDIIGGCVTAKDMAKLIKLKGHTNLIGTQMAPAVASLVGRSVKSLPLRIMKHSENALEVAKFLNSNKKVKRVYYPGLPSHKGHEIAKKQMKTFAGMISFEMNSLEDAKTVANNIRLIHLSLSLGGTESNLDHPASMTRAEVPEEDRLRDGISNGLLRLSVGLEDAEDIKEDLRQSIEKIE